MVMGCFLFVPLPVGAVSAAFVVAAVAARPTPRGVYADAAGIRDQRSLHPAGHRRCRPAPFVYQVIGTTARIRTSRRVTGIPLRLCPKTGAALGH